MSIEKLNPEQVKPQWAMNVDYISKINEIIDHINKVIVKNDHVVDGVMYGIQESIKLPEHVWSPVERAKLQHKKFENLQERYRRLEDAHKKLVKGHKSLQKKYSHLKNCGHDSIMVNKIKTKLLQTQNDLINLRNEYNDLKAKNTENKLGREMASRECDRLKVEIIALKTENEQLKSLIHDPELFNYFDEIKSNNESLKKESDKLKDQIGKYVNKYQN